MRIARFSRADSVSFGVVDGDPDDPGTLTVTSVTGHPFAPFSLGGEPVPLADVRLLAPVLPSKVVGVGRNFAEHAKEMGGEVPEVPLLFLKPSTSVVGPGERIRLPQGAGDVHHEAELAVVISRLCRDVPVDRVADVVLGFTCANDVTSRTWQRGDGQWWRAKGSDTFCPLGPWVETDLDPADLALTCRVDGEPRQEGRTSQMVRGVAEMVSLVSSAMTLLPGDVLLTGTPAGVGPIRAGEQVSVTVEGIGTLTNPVVDRD